ncbi:single-stranded-DNA-specific exonuclease RecJ [Isachenkonia alkalipeptolytica]|uniref:Single-stranded-DNA-specific exonuclease RecJ n=1 Tax=Isachenkonia alkalipeptolytica TaxID=2565777 RepID=A0AA43XJM3_9CLOT|nr:single-stranded-DNA-specific exonuclease RecJ [Isachenkonia alkalipeptolytica]NBG87977.1 single-stranded-DNA-specific exonuclease RecJ [Isachenkonia alkalipeptolytica]
MHKTLWKTVEGKGNENVEIQGVDPVITRILEQKGITDVEEIQEFLSAKPKKTYDPFLMKDLAQACDLIEKVYNNRGHILIYGDYDVDGITSTTLLMDFFQGFYNNTSYHIPNRQEEGYGLNLETLKELVKTRKPELLISVDCGITALEEVDFLKEQGVEVIITDHHTPGEELPKSLVINPKRKDCDYPFKELSGCGVAFKLTQGIQRRLQLGKKILNQNLDLVALATVADVVPLRDENRTLLKYGLQRINERRRLGLKVLLEEIRLGDKKITPGHIGFMIGPHFNAGGRVAEARTGVELLMTRDQNRAREIARHLARCNEERQEIQQVGLERCLTEIEEKYSEDDFLIVDLPGLHEGVIGIIAGRIKEIYYRPVLVLTNSEDPEVYKGSGRSIEGFDLYYEMSGFKDLFQKFGGHPAACGLSLEKGNIPRLRQELNKRAKELKEENPELFLKKIKIYAKLEEEKLHKGFIDTIHQMEPYGMGNEKPLFLLENLRVPAKGKQRLGKEKTHLKLKGRVPGGKQELEAIGFNMVEQYFEELQSPDALDVVFFPEMNVWKGRESVQLLIQDLRSREEE